MVICMQSYRHLHHGSLMRCRTTCGQRTRYRTYLMTCSQLAHHVVVCLVINHDSGNLAYPKSVSLMIYRIVWLINRVRRCASPIPTNTTVSPITVSMINISMVCVLHVSCVCARLEIRVSDVLFRNFRTRRAGFWGESLPPCWRVSQLGQDIHATMVGFSSGKMREWGIIYTKDEAWLFVVLYHEILNEARGSADWRVGKSLGLKSGGR